MLDLDVVFPKDGLVDAKLSANFLDIAPSTFWAKVKSHQLPQPIKIGNCTRWRATDIRRVAGETDHAA